MTDICQWSRTWLVQMSGCGLSQVCTEWLKYLRSQFQDPQQDSKCRHWMDKSDLKNGYRFTWLKGYVDNPFWSSRKHFYRWDVSSYPLNWEGGYDIFKVCKLSWPLKPKWRLFLIITIRTCTKVFIIVSSSYLVIIVLCSVPFFFCYKSHENPY